MAIRRDPTELGKYLKLFVYGQPGCGKTRLVATTVEDPRFGNCLMLEAFGNPVSLRKVAHPDIISIEGLSDFNDPYDWLLNGQDPKHPYCKQMGLKPPYKTLIIDGTTEVQRYIVRTVTRDLDIGPGDLTSAMQRQGFGQLLGTLLHWASLFVNLDMNVILTGLEALKTPEGAIAHTEPLIWGQAGLEICGYVYMVMRLSVKARVDPEFKGQLDVASADTERVGQIWPTLRTYAKDQYDCGIDYIVNPTMSKIMDLVEPGS